MAADRDEERKPVRGRSDAPAGVGLAPDEERFRVLMESLDAGVSLSTLDGKILYANPEILRMSGFARLEDFIAVPAEKRYANPQERDQFVAELQRTGMVRHRELRSLRKDGSTYWVSISARVLEDPEDGSSLILSSIQDITERKQAEKKLRESEERFRMLFELSPVGMTLVGTDFRFLHTNPAFREMVGYSESELLRMTFNDVTHPDDRAAGASLTLRTLEGEIEGFQLEKRYIRRDGTTVWGVVNSTLVRDDGGAPLYFMSQIHDISNRRSAEEALRESEERLRAIIQNEPECVKLLDREGRVLEMNPAGLEIIQAAFEEVSGQKAVALVAEEDRPAFLEMIEGVFRGERRSLVFDMVGMKGRRRTLETVSVPLRGPRGEGAVTALLGVTRDITERKLMEERLRQSEKMEAIGQLAGGVAHDFNNMLLAILGNAEIILNRTADPAIVPYAQAIVSSAQRSAGLTSQLLAFARRGRYQRVPVNVHAVIDDVIELLGHSLDKRITVEKHLQARRAVVMGDPSQLHNALLNLALNARDAMAGGGTLTFLTAVEERESLPVAIKEEVAEAPLLRIDVTDTGTGLSEEARSHLFEPFFTTKPPGKGTGLGLASVYGTAKGHGGTVTVESGEHSGTTFRLFLPLSADDAAAAKDPEPSVPARGARRILVVDDEPALRTFLESALKMLGYETVSAANGAEAVALFRAAWQSVDLVLLDVMMPVMGGYQTLSEMRAIHPAVKAIITSGYALDEEVQRILGLGAVGFVQKPFRVAEISMELARALES